MKKLNIATWVLGITSIVGCGISEQQQTNSGLQGRERRSEANSERAPLTPVKAPPIMTCELKNPLTNQSRELPDEERAKLKSDESYSISLAVGAPTWSHGRALYPVSIMQSKIIGSDPIWASVQAVESQEDQARGYVDLQRDQYVVLFGKGFQVFFDAVEERTGTVHAYLHWNQFSLLEMLCNEPEA